MRLPLLSLRSKMLLPAAVAVIATVAAIVVTTILSNMAATRLREARTKNFPAMVFYKDMAAKLAEVDALLKYVGESQEFDKRIDVPENMYYDMADAFDTQKVLPVEIAKELKAELDAYWQAARTDAAARVNNSVRFSAEHAARPNAMHAYGGSAEEKAALARTAEIDNQFQALRKKFDDRAKESQKLMDEALGTASTKQLLSLTIGAIILFGSALLSAVLAWIVSGFTARPVRRLSEAALRIAEGDLTQVVQVESQDEVGVLARSFQRMVERLRGLVATLKSASEEMATAAEQLYDHTRAQSAMLERQASGVAETSSTTRELEQTSSVAASRAASVLEVAKRAAEMSDAGRAAAEKSAGELHRIQGSVEGIVSQSTQLLEQARQVGDIVETVRDLATQSHVLSLNASIEAAKAGEAGKSFAVVAHEVRALAEQSGHGASRIAKMVSDILAAVQSTRDMTERGSQGMTGSLDQIRASGDSLREIGGIVRETSDAALHIASAVQQQSTGIAQIAMAMRDLDKGMEETIGRIRSLEASAQHVAETATRISGVAAEFRL
jgi:methyl-accepting chemotaxis protein